MSLRFDVEQVKYGRGTSIDASGGRCFVVGLSMASWQRRWTSSIAGLVQIHSWRIPIKVDAAPFPPMTRKTVMSSSLTKVPSGAYVHQTSFSPFWVGPGLFLDFFCMLRF